VHGGVELPLASRPDRYRFAPTSTTTDGSAIASISGSSPAVSRSARIAVPSDTIVTPSSGRRLA